MGSQLYRIELLRICIYLINYITYVCLKVKKRFYKDEKILTILRLQLFNNKSLNFTLLKG